MDIDKELDDIKETTEVMSEEFVIQGSNYRCKVTVLCIFSDEEDKFVGGEWRLRINEILVTDLPPAPPMEKDNIPPVC